MEAELLQPQIGNVLLVSLPSYLSKLLLLLSPYIMDVI